MHLASIKEGRLTLELPVGQSANPNLSPTAPGRGNLADTFADFTAVDYTAHQGAWGATASTVEPGSRRRNTKFDGHLGQLFSKIHSTHVLLRM